MTAAHKNLPFGTWVRVTRDGGEQSVLVKVNDRLPQSSRHVIDVSLAAAEILGLIQPGYAQVRIEAMDLEELDRLIGHFAEKENSGLRLRPYYLGIAAPRVEPDFRLKKINSRGSLTLLK
jgi:rare lipoprotein A